MWNMRFARKQKGLTLKGLGALLGVSESTVSLYETGGHQPDNDMLVKIADILEVSVDYLLGRENKKPDAASIRTDAITPDERKLLEDYRSLNAQGKESVRQFVYMALAVYKKSSDLPGVERTTS